MPGYSSTDAQCVNAISYVGTTLVDTYGVVIRDIRREPTIHPNNPFPGSETLLISLLTQFNLKVQTPYEKKHTQKADALLNSPAVMETLSNKIMNACPNISVIDIHPANSGDINPVFRMPSGPARRGIWIDICGQTTSKTLKYEWGFFVAC